ncbi:MAG TPA: 50S ribosomal protein L9 [Candidatus Udaeobacter sp.]|nr:50S ribosomal protein L9 [Candidatus Udaeobacter sp.]
MQVVFIQNVAGIGRIDDVKEVSEGYARNFLFAKNLAVPATTKVLSDLKSRKNKKTKDHEMELREQQSLADKLEGYELSLKERAGTAGNLYAAVGQQKVAEALVKSGFKISKDQILLKPIKEIGQFSAKIKFSHGLESAISIIVSKI